MPKIDLLENIRGDGWVGFLLEDAKDMSSKEMVEFVEEECRKMYAKNVLGTPMDYYWVNSIIICQKGYGGDVVRRLWPSGNNKYQ